MNVYLQWLVIPPLALGVLFFLWVQQSAILEERGEETPRSRREHVMNVLATCGIFEWSCLILAVLWLFWLISSTLERMA